MSMQPATPIGPAVAELTKPPAASARDEVEDRFLALLVSQLRNQDPLNPLQNSELTSQLAQINTVRGLERLNETLKALLGQVQTAQPLQAAAVVGRQVLVAGDALTLAGGAARAGFELPHGADALRITVKDASGSAVHVADLGARAAGLHTFEWDGIADSGAAAAPGTYRFELAATVAGKPVPASTLTLGRVDAVLPGKEALLLRVGGQPPVPLSAVKQIL
jgi:flagellar basal-body rod modification protein FlgD